MGADGNRESSNEQDANKTDRDSGSQSTTSEQDGRSTSGGATRGSGGAGRPLRSSPIQRASAGSVSLHRRRTESSGPGYVNYDTGPDHEGLSQRYGVEFVKEGQAQKLQRFESEFGGERIYRWVDEGMTVETMGKPRDMQAFRERQDERPPEVPTDVERRNEASLQRSIHTARETGPAGETQVPDVVRSVVSSPGQALDGTVQREMESKMGEEFSDVRIHTGPQAAAATDSLNARAFTMNNHVAFNRGEYQPDTDSGKEVLAHELTHVRQGTDGAVSLLPKADGDHPDVSPVGPGLTVQPRLEVSSPSDPAEKEAERVADQVMKMDDPADAGADTPADGNEVTASTTETTGSTGADTAVSTEAETDDQSVDRTVDIVQTVPVSRSAGGGGVSGESESDVRGAVQGGGKPLPSETRSEMESKMGADFSNVQIHTGSDADEAAQSINAKAYTMGSNIAFAKGNYNPDSNSGKQLLAHELTHVVQQSGGAQTARNSPERVVRDVELEGQDGDGGEFGNAGDWALPQPVLNTSLLSDDGSDVSDTGALDTNSASDNSNKPVVNVGFEENRAELQVGYQWSGPSVELQLMDQEFPVGSTPFVVIVTAGAKAEANLAFMATGSVERDAEPPAEVGLDVEFGPSLSGSLSAGIQGGVGAANIGSVGVGGELTGSIGLSGAVGGGGALEIDQNGEDERITGWELTIGELGLEADIGAELDVFPYARLAGFEWRHDLTVGEWDFFEGEVSVSAFELEGGDSGIDVSFGEFGLDGEYTGPSWGGLGNVIPDFIQSLAEDAENEEAREIIREMEQAGALEEFSSSERAQLLDMLEETGFTADGEFERMTFTLVETANGPFDRQLVLVDAYYRDQGSPPESGEDVYDWIDDRVHNHPNKPFVPDYWDELIDLMPQGDSPTSFTPYEFWKPNEETPRSHPLLDKYIRYYRSIGGMEVENEGFFDGLF